MADVLHEPLANGRSLPARQDGFPVLRATALRPVTVDFTQTKGGDETAHNNPPVPAEPGDLLVSRVSGSRSLVGEGALVDVPPRATTFPDTMIRVRVQPSLVDPRYLAHLWNSPIVRRQIADRARQGAPRYTGSTTVIWRRSCFRSRHLASRPGSSAWWRTILLGSTPPRPAPAGQWTRPANWSTQ
ncbi:hypothetical protein ACFQZ0_12035 [Streptomyces erythrogriseus]